MFASALLFTIIPVDAQINIHPLTGIMEGHSVGGITTDLVGNVYVADFGEFVWKITPEGRPEVFASGLYGASGNAVDNQGNLLQSNFYGDSITKIDRKGQMQPFVTSGLSGPVGITIDRKTGDVYVANCRSNSIVRIATDGSVSTFAKSDLFKCPNGICFDADGNLYVVNFRNNRMLKIDPKGVVTLFATISEKGLGHLSFKKDRFYVTAFESHEIYEVTLNRTVKRILGTGKRGVLNGTETDAQLSFPNGIACDPWTSRLYINEYVNDSVSSLPRRAIVREIALQAEK